MFLTRWIVLAFLTPLLSHAITSPEIVLHTLEAVPSCLHYEVRGSCQWLTSNVADPIAITPKVRHYVPDAVVTVYNSSDNYPWLELRPVEKAAEKGGEILVKAFTNLSLESGARSGVGSKAANLYMFEATVHGHPLTSLNKFIPSYLLHKSNSTPLLPYYQSKLDALSWRTSSMEILNLPYVVSPQYSVGTKGRVWGGIYPRTGIVQHREPSSASAVVALRALHLVTSSSWSHVSKNIDHGECGKECKTSGEALDSPNTLFQPIYPNPSHSCSKISEAPIETDGARMWIVWREYNGCIQHHGKFIGSI